MDKQLTYYTIKRSFLFLDEWLFYIVLYKLYSDGHYDIMKIVLVYGISCIYTSYKNIDLIESKISNVKQLIWVTDKTPIEYAKTIYNYWYPITKLLLTNEDDDYTDISE